MISTKHCTGGSSQCTKARRGNKKYPDWKEVIKLLSVGDMIAIIEYLMKYIKK